MKYRTYRLTVFQWVQNHQQIKQLIVTDSVGIRLRGFSFDLTPECSTEFGSFRWLWSKFLRNIRQNVKELIPCFKFFTWGTFNWHFVKGVGIRSFSGPHFLAFGLNMEKYFVSLRIQSKSGKYGPQKLWIQTLFMQCELLSFFRNFLFRRKI